MSTTDLYTTGFYKENGKTIAATSCTECTGSLHTYGGEINSTECGLIDDEDWLDHGSERRLFDEETERTGAPLTTARYNYGLPGEIWFGWDA